MMCLPLKLPPTFTTTFGKFYKYKAPAQILRAVKAIVAPSVPRDFYLCCHQFFYMFNKRIKIKALLQNEATGYEATVMGWVRTFRNNQFIALNDGSTNNNIQIVAALGSLDEATLKTIAGLHPIGRLGKSEEVAQLALFLGSDQSSFVTGSYYPVDGGYLAQ